MPARAEPLLGIHVVVYEEGFVAGVLHEGSDRLTYRLPRGGDAEAALEFEHDLPDIQRLDA